MEKNKCPERDTMSSVVIKSTLQMMKDTGESVSFFATERLIPALEFRGLVDLGSEGIHLADYMRWRGRCVKRAQRVLAGETPLPADWIVVWMSVLPELYRDRCSQKLAAMQGLQWVRLPTYNRIRAGSRVESVEAEIDAITVKFGDVLAHAAPAHDGYYDQQDDKVAVKMLQNRLWEMKEYLLREILNIELATGISPDHFDIGMKSPMVAGAGGTHAAS